MFYYLHFHDIDNLFCYLYFDDINNLFYYLYFDNILLLILDVDDSSRYQIS